MVTINRMSAEAELERYKPLSDDEAVQEVIRLETLRRQDSLRLYAPLELLCIAIAWAMLATLVSTMAATFITVGMVALSCVAGWRYISATAVRRNVAQMQELQWPEWLREAKPSEVTDMCNAAEAHDVLRTTVTAWIESGKPIRRGQLALVKEFQACIVADLRAAQEELLAREATGRLLATGRTSTATHR